MHWQACVDADACVIPQGANTGLTGGSVPRGEALDRPTVVINMTNLTSISPIDGGERLVCLAGAGIHSALGKAAEMQRESHSVLGSLLLNPKPNPNPNPNRTRTRTLTLTRTRTLTLTLTRTLTLTLTLTLTRCSARSSSTRPSRPASLSAPEARRCAEAPCSTLTLTTDHRP